MLRVPASSFLLAVTGSMLRVHRFKEFNAFCAFKVRVVVPLCCRVVVSSCLRAVVPS